MALDQDIALIGGVALFRSLDRDALRLIAFSAKRRSLKEGELLFRRGAPTTGGAIVTRGMIALSPAGADGAPYLAGPGTLIGELALMIETRHPASALARQSSEALLVSRSLFRRVITEYPDSAASIRAALAARMEAQAAGLEGVRALLLGIP